MYIGSFQDPVICLSGGTEDVALIHIVDITWTVSYLVDILQGNFTDLLFGFGSVDFT